MKQKILRISFLVFLVFGASAFTVLYQKGDLHFTLRYEKVVGFSDVYGNQTVPGYFEKAKNFKNGSAPVMVNGCWGVIDEKGSMIVPAEYSFADNMYSGMAEVWKKNESEKIIFFVDATQNLLKTDYPQVKHFSEGLAPVMNQNCNWGFIDTSGNEKVPLVYDEVSYFCNERAAAKMGNLWGYINIRGESVISFQYSEAGDFCDGFAPVKADTKWGVIDINGVLVVQCQYDWISTFNEHTAVFKKDGKYGIMNESGTVIIQCDYEKAVPFYEGYAAVCKNQKWGFVDKKGNTFIECKYDSVTSFQNGAAFFICNKKNYENEPGFVLTNKEEYMIFNYYLPDDVSFMMDYKDRVNFDNTEYMLNVFGYTGQGFPAVVAQPVLDIILFGEKHPVKLPCFWSLRQKMAEKHFEFGNYRPVMPKKD